MFFFFNSFNKIEQSEIGEEYYKTMEKLKINIYFFQWMKYRTFYQNLTFPTHQTINTNSSSPTWETTSPKRQITSTYPPLEEIKVDGSDTNPWRRNFPKSLI